MSDVKAVLNSDSTIKAVLTNNGSISKSVLTNGSTVKGMINNGVTIYNRINGGTYIHFDVVASGSNQIFTSPDLEQYSIVEMINLFKNGVNLEPTNFVKISQDSIQVTSYLNAGDTIDILATGSATNTDYYAGGSNGTVQFNKNSFLEGNSSFTFNDSTGTLTVPSVTGNLHGEVTGNVIGDTTGVHTGDVFGNVNGDLSGNVTGTLTGNSFGIHTGNVIGNIQGNVVGNLQGNVVGNTNGVHTGNVIGNVNATTVATVNLSATANVSLGNVSNIKITGGSANQFLRTDGAGNLSWSAGGGVQPGGTDTQIQFNDANSLGGSSAFTFTKGNAYVSLNGSMNVTGNVTTTGTTTIQQAKEKVNVSAGGANTLFTFNVLDQAIVIKNTPATGNFTLNITGNGATTINSVLSNNQSLTCTFVNTVTTAGYIPNVVQVDGNVVKVWWNGNTPAYTTISGTAKDVYTFNIIKTATNTYTVLGAAGRCI